MKVEKNRKIVVAGHICLDITPAFPKEKTARIDELLKPGSLVQMGKTDVHTGGCVGNTGLAMKVLGADVSLMGKVGEDAFGEIICSILDSYGAQTGLKRAKGIETSYSIVLAPPFIDRIFLHDSGCNDTYCVQDLDFSIIKEASIFHFGYPTIMKQMYANQGKELIQMFQQVKQLSVATSLDMAAIDASSQAAQVDWKTLLKEVMPYVDFFAPSMEELAYMIAPNRLKVWKERAKEDDITNVLSIEEDIRPLADMLLSWGAKVVLIKCGVKGLYVKTNTKEVLKQVGGGLEKELMLWANQERFEKSYKPEQVLSATGAGDTCIAAFLTAISKGYPLTRCLELAAATGACCVSAYDSISGLKPFAKLNELIEAGWEKI